MPDHRPCTLRRRCPLAWALALLAGCHACGASRDSTGAIESGHPRVTLTPVTRRDLTVALSVAGTLEATPGSDVHLAAQSPGLLIDLGAAEGDRVVAGQILARLDPAPLVGTVRQAEAALSEAQATARNDARRLTRAKRLYDLGISAGQEVDDARAQSLGSQAKVATARSALEAARLDLQRTELRAPFDGVVVHLFQAAGEQVDANKPIVQVARLEVLELRAAAASQDLERLREGMRATVTVERRQATLPAEVIAVSPGLEPTTGEGTVRLRLQNPGDLRLGQLARARVELERHHGVPAVPQTALVPRHGDASGRVAVVVVGEDLRARQVPIEVGATDGTWTEVRSGVAIGTPVISDGAYALPEGTRVSIAPPSRGDGGSRSEP